MGVLLFAGRALFPAIAALLALGCARSTRSPDPVDGGLDGGAPETWIPVSRFTLVDNALCPEGEFESDTCVASVALSWPATACEVNENADFLRGLYITYRCGGATCGGNVNLHPMPLDEAGRVVLASSGSCRYTDVCAERDSYGVVVESVFERDVLEAGLPDAEGCTLSGVLP